MSMKRLLAAVILCAVVCSSRGEETWLLYHAPDADVEALQQTASSAAPQGTAIRLQALPDVCQSARDLETTREAINAGVHVLPCLVLQDARGVYATLPLRGLTTKGVLTARKLASHPMRSEYAKQRRLAGSLYYDAACVQCNFVAREEKLKALDHMRSLAESERLPVGMRQLIALRYFYPSLMLLYAAEYNGAHTPASERLFLQAVSALEFARDLDADSELGRLAHEKREQLRAARLQARKLD